MLPVPPIAQATPARAVAGATYLRQRRISARYLLTEKFGNLPSGWHGPNAIRSIEKAQVHHATRRRGCVAAGGASAATGEAGDRRSSGHEHLVSLERLGGGVCSKVASTWLDRRTHHRVRISLGRRK